MHNAVYGKKLTRRGFVALAGLGALSLAGCSSASPAASSAQSDVLEVSDAQADVMPDPVDELLGALTLEQKVAQLFVVRPEDVLGVHGVESGAEDSKANSQGQLTAAGSDVKRAIDAVPVGGIAFFGGNLVEPSQSKELIADMSAMVLEACGVAPLLCVDEEGGTVARIANNEAFGVENVGDASDIGGSALPEAAEEAAVSIAEYLRPLGFNTDFAPVADVANNPESQVMSERSFGADAQSVADMVSAQVEGFLSEDMVCTLKHFPGLGAAVGDSHDSRIVISSTLDELLATELVPFAAGIEAGAPMVMMGHLSVPAVVGDNTPSSLSKAMVTDVLRGRLGFDGVVITDSLGMGAVTDCYKGGEAAVSAIEAGCDIALMPVSLSESYNAVLDAVESGRLTEDRIDESVRRIISMKLRFGIA